MTRATAREHGFSLLELLIALAIAGLIFTLIAGAVRLGGQAWQRATAVTDAGERAHAVDRILRRTITRLRPAPLDSGRNRQRVYFDGRENSLQAVVLSPSLALPGGLYRVRFHSQTGAEGTALVLDILPFNLDPSAAPLSRTVIAEGLGSVRFAYGRTTGEDVRWSARWTEDTGLPDLVRATVAPRELAGGGASQEIIVRPALLIHDAGQAEGTE